MLEIRLIEENLMAATICDTFLTLEILALSFQLVCICEPMFFQDLCHSLELSGIWMALGEIKWLRRSISKATIGHSNLHLLWFSIWRMNNLPLIILHHCVNPPILNPLWHVSCRKCIVSSLQMGWSIIEDKNMVMFRIVSCQQVHCFTSLCKNVVTRVVSIS